MTMELTNAKRLTRKGFSLIIILISAVFLRFFNLDSLPGEVFDEVYYPVFALNLLSGQDFYSVHPPMGVYLTSLSIYLYSILPWTESLASSGFDIKHIDPISYRWLPALVGSALVYASYLLSLQIYAKRNFALLVALYFCLDGSMLVDSRFGLINIYLVFFGFLGLLFFLKAIQNPEKLLYIFVSALFFGLALAVKWNGLGFWALSLCLMILIAFTYRLDTNLPCQLGFQKHTKPTTWVILIFVPIVVYTASWIPYFLLFEGGYYLEKHSHLLSFHVNHTDPKPHPYESKWYTWPFSQRPIGYFFESTEATGRTNFTSVHLFPNPVLYWFSFGAIFFILGRFLVATKKLFIHKTMDSSYFLMFFVVFGYFGNLLPWSLVSRSTFLYHYQPSSGFAFMSLAFFIIYLFDQNNNKARLFGLIVLALILASSMYWAPLQLGINISSDYFYQLMWFESWI